MAAIRQCDRCGEREAYWDDGECEPEPCPAVEFDEDDIADETMAAIREECRQYIASEARGLETMAPTQAGHDFYLTRNGHGAGYWDRGLGERGDRLTKAAHAWGSSTLYAGDDGKLYTA